MLHSQERNHFTKVYLVVELSSLDGLLGILRSGRCNMVGLDTEVLFLSGSASFLALQLNRPAVIMPTPIEPRDWSAVHCVSSRLARSQTVTITTISHSLVYISNTHSRQWLIDIDSQPQREL